MHRLTLLAILTVMLAATPATIARAQGGIGGPDAPSPLLQEDPEESEDNSDPDAGGFGLWSKILVFGGAALVVIAIGWVIIRDARRSAPKEERKRGDAQPAEGQKLSPRERERRAQRKRAAAKRAKQSRKRNRR